jgi:hypothetical protein
MSSLPVFGSLLKRLRDSGHSLAPLQLEILAQVLALTHDDEMAHTERKRTDG